MAFHRCISYLPSIPCDVCLGRPCSRCRNVHPNFYLVHVGIATREFMLWPTKYLDAAITCRRFYAANNLSVTTLHYTILF